LRQLGQPEGKRWLGRAKDIETWRRFYQVKQ